MARALQDGSCVIYIGTSGWSYRSWRDHLYRDLPQRKWLAQAARTFGALEINGSFYTQIKPETYRRWHDDTPPDTVFTLKGHRFVTHYKRLIDVGESVARLRDQALGLGDKLKVVLWQLPANMAADAARLARFLVTLQAWPQVRHTLELRHRSWFTDEIAALLRGARVASCLSDAPDFPMWRAVTTDLVYVRLHGHTRKYASSYSHAHLQRWAGDVRAWSDAGMDVHVYFDNDAEGAAVENALELKALTGRSPGPRTRRRRA
jgi:uncharacterized protein YecE (DUF72 family)